MMLPLRNPYRACSLLLALGLTVVLLYPLLLGNRLPVPAMLSQLTGAHPPSRGLSRAFALIVRGRLVEAQAMNPHALRVFAFFALQLPLRLLAARWAIRGRAVLLADIALSVVLFVLCLWPLIVYTCRAMASLF